MMAPPLLEAGHKKIYMIGVDAPTIEHLPKVMEPMAESYGAEIVGLSKVPGGTTDFQQFVLAAEDAGADGVILPLGENEAVQVLQAAQQLGTEARLLRQPRAPSARTTSRSSGSFAKQMYFNAELPPVTGEHEDAGRSCDVIADLATVGVGQERAPEGPDQEQPVPLLGRGLPLRRRSWRTSATPTTSPGSR